MARYLSVDVGGTKTEIARVSLERGSGRARGKTEESRTIGTGNFGGAEELFSEVIGIMDGMKTPDVKGAGISCGGFIDYRRGMVLDWTKSRFIEGYPIRERLEGETGLPVSLRNDVECFTMGEWAFGAGAGKDCKLFAGVVLGTGIGACLLLNGEPFKGRHGYAGEIGEFEVDGKLLEDYASGAALKRLSGMEGERLHELAGAGDSGALDSFREYGRRVGAVVRNVLAAYDPDIIVLGGSIAKSFGYFSDAMRGHLREAYTEPVRRGVKVVPASLDNAALLGAAVPLMV